MSWAILNGLTALRSLLLQIAHSWTGNLVTNASWEHFWLNEGWTVFLERKIVGRLQVSSVTIVTLQLQATCGITVL